MVSRFLTILLVSVALQYAAGLSPVSLFGTSKAQRVDIDFASSNEDSTDTSNACESRRIFLSAAAMQICLLGATSPAKAAADGATVYKSGKAPIVPGQKPKDKSDVKGTRKDPDFLRSIADCRNQCQSSNGPDGFAKAKEDCLSECQDICCTTYEQCTFNIVPRL
ncbi:unnamed protein product [Cylindrotheca closterium]|uniref:SREBP regulating gene protein n=1 Tax=Cylindrotheca closterium TaxID=2856 RepID=A0AAD2FFW0_9STRA|nr:unnamed protein product [Cylindrotheca closterium]